LLGTLKDMYKRIWRPASLSTWAPFWGTWRRAHLPGTFKSWTKGAQWMKCLSRSLSEEAPWRGLVGAPSLGTLEYMLRRSLDAGISLYGGPFVAKGKPVCGGSPIPGTLIDE